MGLKLTDQLRYGLGAVVNLVLLAIFLLLALRVFSQNFPADGFQSAKGHQHDVVGIVLLDNLMLGLILPLHTLLLVRRITHKKYNE